MAIRAHVSFPLRDSGEVDGSIADYFTNLGYQLEEQAPGKWTFRRGSKLASLFRCDIRKYATTLHVSSAPEPDGVTRVTCEWEVWTFATPAKETDVEILHGEGRQLKTLLRRDIGSPHVPGRPHRRSQSAPAD